MLESDAPSAAKPSTPPAIGVIIPTYNRCGTLLTCLRHLETQSCKNFEVVVVDDGSTDSTRAALASYAQTSPFPLRCLHQPNGGPARARNLAIVNLRATVCVMIGDDIFPTPEFIATHLAFHEQHPAREAAAVGYTRWCETGQVVTPFMRWLDNGIQFAYGDLFGGVTPSWKHFWTSNLSLKTDYLRANPFHEGFSRYGMEDMELGYRLSVQHGLRMFFLPDAVAGHLHPTTFRRNCRRALDAGAAAYRFGELWPEHRYSVPKSWPKRLLLPLLLEPWVVLPVLRSVADVMTRFWCPNPLIKPVLLLHEWLGYRQAATQSKAA
jgi:glycosyltransferase involved in cell wall biosynthesis